MQNKIERHTVKIFRYSNESQGSVNLDTRHQRAGAFINAEL